MTKQQHINAIYMRYFCGNAFRAPVSVSAVAQELQLPERLVESCLESLCASLCEGIGFVVYRIREGIYSKRDIVAELRRKERQMVEQREKVKKNAAPKRDAGTEEAAPVVKKKKLPAEDSTTTAPKKEKTHTAKKPPVEALPKRTGKTPPMAEAAEAPAAPKKEKKAAAPKAEKEAGSKKPGVLATIKTLLEKKWVTKEGVHEILVQRFPEREPDALMSTTKIQISRHRRETTGFQEKDGKYHIGE